MLSIIQTKLYGNGNECQLSFKHQKTLDWTLTIHSSYVLIYECYYYLTITNQYSM